MPVKLGEKKHQWRPGRFRSAEVSTCDGCGAQVQRVMVAVSSRAAAIQEPKVHNMYAYRFRLGPELIWETLWTVPSCSR